MVDYLDSLITTVGPMAFFALAMAAMLEYVVPPFPGDSVILLGGIYAVRGEYPWYLVLLVVTTGSLAGAAINYGAGTWIARRMERHPDAKTFLGVSVERLHRVQARMRRHGAWLLIINRFLPGVRALIFVAAGAAGMPLRRALALGALSAVAHNMAILGLGIAVGGKLEALERLVDRYQTAALGLVGVGCVALVVRALARKRTPVT